jgi:hypothetical protein
MTRRFWVALTFATAACGPPPRGAESLLPGVLASDWRRESLREIPAPSATGALRAFEATYAGPGNLTVDIYQTKFSAVAFEMEQKWKPAANTVAFSKDEYFAVVRWDRAERRALTAFVGALEKALGPDQRQ